MKFKDKLIIYLYNKQNLIDEEYNNILHSVRFRKVDEVDYLECIISKARNDLISEIISDIMVIIGNKPKK